MTAKPPPRKNARQAAGPEPARIVLNEAESDKLRPIGGSSSDRFNNALIRAVAGTAWFRRDQSDEERNQQLFVTVTGLRAFKPMDEIEGMLAAQAMAMHHASMECSRRAMIAEQPTEAAQGFRKAAANASRAFVELLSALDRKRGKGGQQLVRVEHVHVHPGGQAIVGNVATTGGGGTTEIPGGPRALEQLEHAPVVGTLVSPLWSADAEREAVPSPRDAERPLPHARRKQHGT